MTLWKLLQIAERTPDTWKNLDLPLSFSAGWENVQIWRSLVCVWRVRGEKGKDGGVDVQRAAPSPGRRTAAAYGESCKTVKLTQLLSVTVKINWIRGAPKEANRLK